MPLIRVCGVSMDASFHGDSMTPLIEASDFGGRSRLLKSDRAHGKAGGRGDKTTRRVRVQVLALLEKPSMSLSTSFSSPRKPSTRSST
jgi:hypothetical protein